MKTFKFVTDRGEELALFDADNKKQARNQSWSWWKYTYFPDDHTARKEHAPPCHFYQCRLEEFTDAS